MNNITSNELKEFVNKVLRSVEMKDKDLNKNFTKSETIAHRNIINALCSEWSRKFRVYPQGDFEGYKIDFIGRQKEIGRILLAVEIDTGDNEKSWLKLADINAICKVWILLDYKWQARFRSEEERQQTWEDWLYGHHPKHTPDEFNKANRFWYSYGPDADELIVFVKSPDYVGSRSISSEPIVAITSKDTLESTIEKRNNIDWHYFSLLKSEQSFFPAPGTRFTFITDIGEIETNVAGNEKGGYWIQRNLADWYKRHPELKVGDRVRISVIEPMKKYRLEIVK